MFKLCCKARLTRSRLTGAAALALLAHSKSSREMRLQMSLRSTQVSWLQLCLLIVDYKGEIRTRAANGRLRGALEGAGRERHKAARRVLVFESCKNRRRGLREGRDTRTPKRRWWTSLPESGCQRLREGVMVC